MKPESVTTETFDEKCRRISGYKNAEILIPELLKEKEMIEKSETPKQGNQMDNAVLNVKKGQNITIVIEGYEDHTASFEYDDVLQVILTQAQTDLNKRRTERQRLQTERQRLQYEKNMVEQKYQAADVCTAVGSQANYSGLGLYPRDH